MGDADWLQWFSSPYAKYWSHTHLQLLITINIHTYACNHVVSYNIHKLTYYMHVTMLSHTIYITYYMHVTMLSHTIYVSYSLHGMHVMKSTAYVINCYIWLDDWHRSRTRRVLPKKDVLHLVLPLTSLHLSFCLAPQAQNRFLFVCLFKILCQLFLFNFSTPAKARVVGNNLTDHMRIVSNTIGITC